MPWLKRNLYLVIGGLVALALMGVAVSYSLHTLHKEKDITEQLDALTAEYQELVSRKPHPGDDKVNNIAIAKEQHERLKDLLKRTRDHYVPLNYPTGRVQAGEFKLLLETAIQDLQRRATNSGIKLPPNYHFTFSAQRSAMNPDKPELLAPQVVDIKAICDILFNAKIHELISMRRSALTADDVTTSGEFLPNKPETNELAVLMPYEATFRGFSSELANVIEGFYSSPHCFIVKNVTVEKAEIQVSEEESSGMTREMMMLQMMNPYYRYSRMPMGPGRGGGRYGGMDPRYGLGPSVAPPPMVAPAPTPQAKPGIEEHPLKVTLLVQLVRLKPPGEAGGGRPVRRAPALTPDVSGEAAPETAAAN